MKADFTPGIKYIHEGKYVAEVDVVMIKTADDWSPYLSLQDAYKLDEVRDALRREDLPAAAQKARIYTLMPVAA